MKAGESLARIRAESLTEVDKGHRFEELFIRLVRQSPEFEIDDIWRWKDWPLREGRDLGVDLVAQRKSGEYIAIQCKCYDESYTVGRDQIKDFLIASEDDIFALRWLVSTCRLGVNAKSLLLKARPEGRWIDFQEYWDVEVDESLEDRPLPEPWPSQHTAIEKVMEGFVDHDHDRGRLIMACGTGKTFTSLRIAEELVKDGENILFVAPSIALVSQARREWLQKTRRRLRSVVVCSDKTAGGQDETRDLETLECPVTTDAFKIAERLLSIESGVIRAVFCTYQSLRRVIEAQREFNAPPFALAIADEAHRTTGILRETGKKDSIDFQEFHRDDRLHARKRLYMTATPRVYTRESRDKLADADIEIFDMSDSDIYGPEFHWLSFKEAVEAGILSDYRVILLGLRETSVTGDLHRELTDIDISKFKPEIDDMTRVLGVLRAVKGAIKGNSVETPDVLRRMIAFANTIDRSKWYAEALKRIQYRVRSSVSRKSEREDIVVVAEHLDASDNARERRRARNDLENAGEKECRVISNVRLFSEGVDVPSLDAVTFLDPRNSQVDVVQAVGRVMRKSEGKRLGYIVVPVVLPPGCDVIRELEARTDGYKTIGKVLRALQSHDRRLFETQARLIEVYNPATEKELPADEFLRSEDDPLQGLLELEEAEEGIYAHLASMAGLGKRGQNEAMEIADAVRWASGVLEAEKQEKVMARVLDLVTEKKGGVKEVCTIGALMLCNACLLQRRLRDNLRGIVPLEKVARAKDPLEMLEVAWEMILEKDYAPVFRPALGLLREVKRSKRVKKVVRYLAERSGQIADSLSELGYDHAGPLYHRILGSAKSDGAFYTNNVSAILLARLAFSEGLIDWGDEGAVGGLRVMDPACGTGTLLMAALQTIKGRVQKTGDGTSETLHQRLVEDVLCGLDINQHGVQLAACNLTLGAPTVDYKRMNLAAMPHGPQSDETIKLGSLEILNAEEDDLRSVLLRKQRRTFDELEAAQVDQSDTVTFPLRDLDVVIMNPPFTANKNRSEKYGKTKKEIQKYELQLKEALEEKDSDVKGVIHSESIRAFFTPLADALLSKSKGTLATVHSNYGLHRSERNC